MYLLDTNVVSELRKSSCDPHVRQWFQTHETSAFYLSVLVLGELRRGVERLRPRDPQQAARLEAWLIHLDDHYAARRLPITGEIAQRWGRLNAVRPLSTIDSLIAATALEHGLTLVTRNVDDYEGTGVMLLNPFDPAE